MRNNDIYNLKIEL